MASYQRLIIIGNVGRAPELRFTPNGTPVCDFSVAVNEYRRDGENETTWFKVSAWRGLAEMCAKRIHVGDQVLVTGKVRLETFTGRNGLPRGSMTLTADTVRTLGGASEPITEGDENGQ